MPTDAQILTCVACGAANRVATAKMLPGRAPVCGKCRAPLSVAALPLIVTDASFASDVEHAELPVLLDMWAPWCGPCRMIAPVVEELAREWSGRIRVAKMNVDDNPATSSRFNVRSIPALLIFKDGREVDRLVGALPKSEIVNRMQRFTS